MGDRAAATTRRNTFSRFEYKYRLPRGLATAVRACVAAHLPLDAYSARAADGHYDISSLYLDSTDLRLCRESIEGQKNRFKLRIRGYSDDPDLPVFLEIKRRLNTVILKDRVGVARDALVCLETAGGEPAGSAAGQFCLYRRLLDARPQVLVRYRREAFEGPGPNRVRVTFDRDLSCQQCHAWRVDVRGGHWRRVLADQVVVEIKFDGRYPSWALDLVRRFQLQARSVSKYCLSLHAVQPAAIGFLARTEAS